MSARAILRKVFLGFDVTPIPKQKLINLKKYKYSGVDLSLLSKYVLGPYWNALVQLFPLWVAPNLITLIGLLTTITSCILVLYYSPDMTTLLPPCVAFTLFAYQSLDAIDGKQARRTGMAGPLGCDAINMMLMGFISPAMFLIKPDWISLVLMSSAFFTFYVATWEEYQTGTLYLGYISGPVEGTIIVISLCLLSAYFGGSIWLTPVTFPFGFIMPLNHLVVCCVSMFAAVTVLGSFRNVFIKSGIRPMIQMIPFTLTTAIVTWTYSVNPSLQQFPNFVLFFLMWGFAFACSVARIIAAHITKDTFPYWTPAILPVFVISLVTICERVDILRNIEPMWAILGVGLTFSIWVYLRLVLKIIDQICNYLKIACLRVARIKG